MNQIKVGKFIAKLRKDHNMTQEQLGETLGVTNKTISRWENGNYMPSIEMLQILSQTFKVSMNELIFGEYILDENFRRQADMNLVDVVKENTFSFEEQRNFWISKWHREHISLFVVLFMIPIVATILFLINDIIWGLGLIPLLCLIEYAWQNNKMMIYVENQLYGKKKK